MKKHIIKVDRKPLSGSYIQSRQDFGKVLKGVKHLKPPIWKSPWFYGPIGMASVAITISASTIHANEIGTRENLSPIAFNQEVEKVERKEGETLKDELPVLTQIEKKTKEGEKTKVLLKKNEKPKVSESKIEIKSTQEEIKPIEKQEKTKIIEEKNTLKINFPNFNQIYNGDITFSNLCSENGMSCGDNKITSFSIQYYNGVEDIVEKVEGNKIPDKSCQLIERFNSGTMIFITNIKGVDKNGKSLTFPSMNLTPRY